MKLIGLLCSKGVALISADTQQDVTEAYQGDPVNKLVLQILGEVSECDKAMIAKKLTKGRQTKRLRYGRCEGQKPFGDNPGEADTVDRMKQLRRKKDGERLGFYHIARILNDENRPTRRGGKWQGQSVAKIAKRLKWPCD